MMTMQPVESIAVPAGESVELKPGGYHVMLMDLRKPIAAGDKVPITLTIRGPGSKEVKLKVTAEARAPGSDAAKKH